MLTVTEDAAAHLAQLLSDVPADSVIRFSPGQAGLNIELGQVEPGDTTFDHGEKTVLAFGSTVHQALAEKTLDLNATEQGPQLAVR